MGIDSDIWNCCYNTSE